MTITEWELIFEREILPLRAPADAGEGSYEEYDEKYTEHLENLHDLVRGRGAKLDAAPEMYEAIDHLLREHPGTIPAHHRQELTAALFKAKGD